VHHVGFTGTDSAIKTTGFPQKMCTVAHVYFATGLACHSTSVCVCGGDGDSNTGEVWELGKKETVRRCVLLPVDIHPMRNALMTLVGNDRQHV
jgi:hypothetical protein